MFAPLLRATRAADPSLPFDDEVTYLSSRPRGRDLGGRVVRSCRILRVIRAEWATRVPPAACPQHPRSLPLGRDDKVTVVRSCRFLRVIREAAAFCESSVRRATRVPPAACPPPPRSLPLGRDDKVTVVRSCRHCGTQLPLSAPPPCGVGHARGQLLRARPPDPSLSVGMTRSPYAAAAFLATL